jgi:hypothetical protein
VFPVSSKMKSLHNFVAISRDYKIATVPVYQKPLDKLGNLNETRFWYSTQVWFFL